MQKQQTAPVSPAFNQAASLSEDEKLRLKLKTLNSPLLERAYGRIERKERKDTEATKKNFEENRETRVGDMKREILDKKLKDNYPELKPKDLPTNSREKLAKEALKSAEAAYAAEEKAEMDRIKNESLKVKRAFVAEVTGPQNLKEQFRQAAKDQSR